MTSILQREDFPTLSAEWLHILPTSPANTIFATPRWQSIWWRHFSGGRELHLLALRNERQLVGVLPLSRLGDTAYFVGDADVCDYMDFVVLPEYEDEAIAHLLEYLERIDVQNLDLRSVPSSSPIYTRLPRAAEARGHRAAVEVEESCPQLCLPADWDTYLTGLSKKDRHELRRKMRRAGDSGELRCYMVPAGNGLRQDMEEFFHLQTISHEAKGAFMTPQRRAFFVDVAEAFAGDGVLRFYFLEIDGVRAASTLCFDYADRFMLYNSGYDPTFAGQSAGLVLKAFCLHDAIQLGRRCFDFLRGREAYKYDLGGVDQPVYRVSVKL